jgi:hypothetical protein
MVNGVLDARTANPGLGREIKSELALLWRRFHEVRSPFIQERNEDHEKFMAA